MEVGNEFLGILRSTLPTGLPQINSMSEGRSEIEELAKDAAVLKAFLEEAPKKFEGESAVKDLKGSISTVVYEAEDIIDSYLALNAAGKCRSTFAGRNRTIRILACRSVLNAEFISLMERVETIRMNKLKPFFESPLIDYQQLHAAMIASRTEDEGTRNGRTEHNIQKEKGSLQDDYISRLEDQIDEYVRVLFEVLPGAILSIVGTRGIGKTTLASHIYLHHRIQLEFPIIIWVSLLEGFTVENVFLTILHKFTTQDMSGKSNQELAQLVREYLEGKKFFLFLDNLVDVGLWSEIEGALPMQNSLGKVLITTPNYEVLMHASAGNGIMLSPLSMERSWELLQLQVYGKQHDISTEVETFRNIILTCCGGIARAIVMVGRVLEKKISAVAAGNVSEEIKIWKQFSQSLETYVSPGQTYADHMGSVISFCYVNLPPQVRNCFLYLGMFPLGAEISAWRLTRLWIAEGFIKEAGSRCLEEIAQGDLVELIRCNLAVACEVKHNGEILTVYIDEIVRSFCRKQAAFPRNIFQEITISMDKVCEPPFQKVKEYRRLCIHSHVHDFLSKKPKLPMLHSFLSYSRESIENQDMQSISETFSMLRVFEAHALNFSRFPVEMSNLVHLKYIALSGDDKFNILPKAVSRLWNIQAITVHTTSRTLEIRADIWEMMQLRLLQTNAAMILKKHGKGEGGENLQTLIGVSPESCTEQLGKKAKNLKTLGIRGELAKILDSSFLEKLDTLQELELDNEVASKKPLIVLPKAKSFPPNLRVLTLSSTSLEWKHMFTLGNLANLQELTLEKKAFIGNRWDTANTGFRRLEFLHIHDTDLRRWTASRDSFPTLRTLVLEICKQLEEVPFELGHKLERLEMSHVSKSAVSSAMDIKEAKKQTDQRARFELVINFQNHQVPRFEILGGFFPKLGW